MSNAMEKLRARLEEVKRTVPLAERSAPDKVGGKWFSEPGIFEVVAKAEWRDSKASGNPQNLVISIEDDSGRKQDVYCYLLDKDKNPSPVKLQRILKGFGYNFSQALIGIVWPDLMQALPDLLNGRVIVELSYYGFIPWFVETGLYVIADYSQKGVAAPHNAVIDKVNGDRYNASSREGVQALMKQLSMKEGNKNFDWLRPAPSFSLSPEQVLTCQAFEAVLSDQGAAAMATAAPAAPDKPKPSVPSFLIPKK